jgi:anti-anti-sigma regulatory factor
MMQFKIDTKEKFTVIHLLESHLTANMSVDMEQLLEYLTKDVPHLVLHLGQVQQVDEAAAQSLAAVQQAFYEKNCSCVICGLTPAVESTLDGLELLETMNVTPTESEAWDIVQMEEIERELLGPLD